MNVRCPIVSSTLLRLGRFEILLLYFSAFVCDRSFTPTFFPLPLLPSTCAWGIFGPLRFFIIPHQQQLKKVEISFFFFNGKKCLPRFFKKYKGQKSGNQLTKTSIEHREKSILKLSFRKFYFINDFPKHTIKNK